MLREQVLGGGNYEKNKVLADYQLFLGYHGNVTVY